MKDEFRKDNNLEYVCSFSGAIEEEQKSTREETNLSLIRKIQACSGVDKEQKTYFQEEMMKNFA